LTRGLDSLRQILFLVSVPLFFINFAIPVQAKQLGANAIEIGALFSLFTVSLLVLRPLVGFALDHFGRKPFVVVAMAVYCLANSFYAFAADVDAMYVARLLQGIGASLLLISVDTITADLTVDSDRGMAMGRNIETQTRASLVGATIGFTLLGAMPLVAWKYSFGLFALMAFAAIFVAFFRLPETRKENLKKVGNSFSVESGMYPLLLVIFLTGFASALIQPLYLIYLQDKFVLPSYMLAWAFLPAGIVYAVLPSRLGRLGGRFGNIRVMVAGLLIAGVLYFFLAHLDLFVSYVVVYTLTAVGWAMFDPARKSLTAEFGSVEIRGRIFGVAELYSGIGASLGPLVGGYLYDASGAATAFYVNAVLLIVTAVLASVILVSPVKS
jgi:MFS family permease